MGISLGHGEGILPRERVSFDQDWRFEKNDPAGVGDSLKYERARPWLLPQGNAFRKDAAPEPAGVAPGEGVAYARPDFDDTGWRKLNLPHDWGIEGPFDQKLPGETGKLPWWGMAWYRKSFEVAASDKGRQILLDVDGAMAYAMVWCNGRFVGGWPYGYASWQVDLTPCINFGGRNVVAIRLDNPPNSSRWYPGGGIYRHVWLEKTAPVHVAHWGVSITTPQVSSSSATVNASVRLDNAGGLPVNVQVFMEVYHLESKNGVTTRVPEARSTVGSGSIPAGKSATFSQAIGLKNPRLWSPSTPNLYVAVTRVALGGRIVDAVETTFGVRKAEFLVNDGFHLNGHRVPIRGICLHHDLGALGAAFNESAMERLLAIMKEMGANAIRTSHNPPAPELLDLADRMGFLVMDELVDTWRRQKKPNDYHRLFSDWAEADLRAMIRRDRNHPSIIMWSLGNELAEQGQSDGPTVAEKMVAIAHEEDSTRPATIGVSDAKGGFNGFQKAVDVFGYNYKPQLYRKFREANPSTPIYGSETASAVSSRGEYAFPVTDDQSGGRIGQQMSSYDLYAPGWATTPDAEWRGEDENPFVAGEFIWTGVDYLGEPTPFNSDTTNLLNYHTPEERAKAEAELQTLGKIRVLSRSSYFAPVDLAGFKKDRFYLYQSRWRPDLPMAHILPHWNWPERIGQVTPVFVYTSGDEAELFLNGKSLGRKKKGQYEYRLRWNDVKYEPGELKVVAYKNGRKWAEDVVRTTGPAARLGLDASQMFLNPDGKSLVFITASVLDASGAIVPNASVPLHFEVSGPAEIVAADNGDPTDLTTFSSPDRSSFNGLALVILRAKPNGSGTATIRVSGDGFVPVQASFSVQSSNLSPKK